MTPIPPGSNPVSAAPRPPRSVYAARLGEFPGIAFAEQQGFEQRGRWGELFRQRIGERFDGRVIFEIGCFDAAYLTRIAAKYPSTGFVGLDWKCKAIYDGARRIDESGLKNVLLLRGRGQDVRRIFGDREVDEVWLFHPDPCAGAEELKNRLFAEPFLLDVHAVLRDSSSTLSLKTDYPGYYQWALGLFGLPQPEWFSDERSRMAAHHKVRLRDLMREEQVPGTSGPLLQAFRVRVNSPDFWNDPAVQRQTAARCFAGEATLFESRFLKKRQPIYYLEIGKI